MNKCPLCWGKARFFEAVSDKTYLKCENCQSVFLDKTCHLEPNQEKERYLQHNNNINDPRYQNFVSPVTSSILKSFTARHKGLDYGAGTGPVITKILSDAGYNIKPFDPFFHNQKELLKDKYDYIACCEVIEHFHAPRKEFEKLKNLMEPGGKLYCMTELYNDEIDFNTWYYKNDPTHVFFYSRQAFYWIKEHFAFKELSIRGRLNVIIK